MKENGSMIGESNSKYKEKKNITYNLIKDTELNGTLEWNYLQLIKKKLKIPKVHWSHNVNKEVDKLMILNLKSKELETNIMIYMKIYYLVNNLFKNK